MTLFLKCNLDFLHCFVLKEQECNSMQLAEEEKSRGVCTCPPERACTMLEADDSSQLVQ